MITDIRLQNFRSYQDASFEFEDGVNIIVGPNASGKTNILEAILMIAADTSYRAADKELVSHKKTWARLDCQLGDSKRTIKLRADDNGRLQKEFTINGKTTTRLKFDQKLPTVLFEPNQLQMLTSSPQSRRDYLDSVMEQIFAGFGPIYRAYKRTLAQRNALLKHSHAVGKSDSLFAWNIRLCELGAQLLEFRLKAADEINKRAGSLYKDLSHSRAKLEVNYHSAIGLDNYASRLLKKLERDQAIDQARGFTGSGPHRDDLVLLINGQPLATRASRGEARTAVLVLKQVETIMKQEALGQKPLLLLDDVFSELDGARRRALTENLKDHQSFITTTDADVVVQNFSDHCHLIAL